MASWTPSSLIWLSQICQPGSGKVGPLNVFTMYITNRHRSWEAQWLHGHPVV